MRRGLLFLLAALFVVSLPFVGTAGGVAAAELQPLEIASKGGVHVFAVEMASTPAEQAKGLMFRRELPEGQGMLFEMGESCALRRTQCRSRKRSCPQAARCARCSKSTPAWRGSLALRQATGWHIRYLAGARVARP